GAGCVVASTTRPWTCVTPDGQGGVAAYQPKRVTNGMSDTAMVPTPGMCCTVPVATLLKVSVDVSTSQNSTGCPTAPGGVGQGSTSGSCSPTAAAVPSAMLRSSRPDGCSVAKYWV